MKLEKLDDGRCELYNFNSNAMLWETDVAYVLFVFCIPPFNRRIPHHVCIMKLTFHDKHETRPTGIFAMETTHSNQPIVVTLVPGDLY